MTSKNECGFCHDDRIRHHAEWPYYCEECATCPMFVEPAEMLSRKIGEVKEKQHDGEEEVKIPEKE